MPTAAPRRHRPRSIRRQAPLALALAAALAAAPPAAAQFTVGQRPGEQTEQPDLRPPPVGELGGGDATIITYLAGIGLALAAWGLAILPSQRTHQD